MAREHWPGNNGQNRVRHGKVCAIERTRALARLFPPLALLGCLLLLTVALPDASAQWNGFSYAGLMTDPALDEVSGLVVSRAHPGTLWVENDSGNPAAIYAVRTGGALQATLKIEGAPNVDWEDLAAFDEGGHHYLLLSDTGDNGGIRKTLMLYAIEEPAVLRNATVRPVWSIQFRWPDGPRDCEALAVDARRGEILLVTKKRVPPQLFRLPLHPVDQGLQTAELIGTVAGIPQPTAEEFEEHLGYGRYLAQITAADISADGRVFALMDYRRVYLYRRRGDELSGDKSWAQTLTRTPQQLSFGWLPQAEAMGFTPAGDALYVSGEHLPAPIVRVTVPAAN